MVKDAQAHAAVDDKKKRRVLVEVRNEADNAFTALRS